MWRNPDGQEIPYDRRAAVYDRLVRSPAYNRVAWSTTPAAYEAFAAEAFAAADGPLLEAAAGSAAATAELHARSSRPCVLLDASRAMLDRAERRIAAAGGDVGPGGRVRLVRGDLLRPSDAAARFDTVLALGAAHLFDDVEALVGALRATLVPGGRIHLAGLVAGTRRGAAYLRALHRAGEVAAPRSAEDLRAALGAPERFEVVGCMAFAVLGDGRAAAARRPGRGPASCAGPASVRP